MVEVAWLSREFAFIRFDTFGSTKLLQMLKLLASDFWSRTVHSPISIARNDIFSFNQDKYKLTELIYVIAFKKCF